MLTAAQSAKMHQYYLAHKEEKKIYDKEYNKLHNKHCKKLRHKWYRANRVKILLQKKEYYQSIEKQRKKQKYRSDINYRVTSNLRCRIYAALINNFKSSHTMNLVGCSIEFLKKYLEAKFKPGMSWANYGKWHIDHIKPCASFDLSKSEEQYKCFNYTNLQPLWARENWSKGSKSY